MMPAREFGLSPVKYPCKRECPNRAYDCHAKCELYSKYRAECDAVIEQRSLMRDVLGAYADTTERIRKRRRGK